MKKVTYQAFMKSPKKFLKKFPVEITMFGKTYAYLVPPEALKPEKEIVDKSQVSTKKEPKFDWNKAEYCQSCKKWIPQLLMPYHAHVIHGL